MSKDLEGLNNDINQTMLKLERASVSGDVERLVNQGRYQCKRLEEYLEEMPSSLNKNNLIKGLNKMKVRIDKYANPLPSVVLRGDFGGET